MATKYEIGEDILGADEIIGLTPAMRARLSPMPGMMAGGGLRVREPSKGREYVLGIDSVADIVAGATAILTTRPQVVFRPDRLVIPSSIASDFVINDFKVGKNSQFAAAAAISAETFTQGAFGVRLKSDTAQVSMDIILNVTNIAAATAHRFLASLIGPAVE